MNWANRYEQSQWLCGREPCPFLREHFEILPRGRALDLAMGEGRNAVWLASQGYHVVGVEREEVAINRARSWAREEGRELDVLQLDLELGWVPDPDSFELIVVVNYLQRELFGPLIAALRPGGALLYDARIGEGQFRLRRNELLRAFISLQVAVYRELEERASLLAFRV